MMEFSCCYFSYFEFVCAANSSIWFLVKLKSYEHCHAREEGGRGYNS